MGSENSKQNNVNSKNNPKVKKTVTIVNEPITFEDSAHFDTFEDFTIKKSNQRLEPLSISKNSNEDTNLPVLKSILKPSKYPPLIHPSIYEQDFDKENIEPIEIDQKFPIKNQVSVFSNSDPILNKKTEPLFIKNSEGMIIQNNENMILPLRKVISNPNLPIARPIIISQQAIPQATMEWLDAQTKIIPIRKKISPQKVLQTQEFTSQSERNEWKTFFKNKKFEEAKKTPSKNFGFQNQSEELKLVKTETGYLLSKKVKTVDLKKSSSLSMLPVIQSTSPKLLISNRSSQLKLNETDKRKK